MSGKCERLACLACVVSIGVQGPQTLLTLCLPEFELADPILGALRLAWGPDPVKIATRYLASLRR